MSRMRRLGYSLLEVLLALLLITVALLPLFGILRQANAGVMDASMESLAISLAREPIEVFRGFGYDLTLKYADAPWLAEFPLAPAVVEADFSSPLSYPAEARFFNREISITPIDSGNLPALHVKVQVWPVGLSRARRFFTRGGGVTLETLLFRRPS